VRMPGTQPDQGIPFYGPSVCLWCHGDTQFDGVHCESCHRMWDPFFETAYSGTRESNDWSGYWDELANTGPFSGTLSQNRADLTYSEDATLAQAINLFSGLSLYQGNLPRLATFTENASGQYFMSTVDDFGKYRASFADTVSDHSAHSML